MPTKCLHLYFKRPHKLYPCEISKHHSYKEKPKGFQREKYKLHTKGLESETEIRHLSYNTGSQKKWTVAFKSLRENNFSLKLRAVQHTDNKQILKPDCLVQITPINSCMILNKLHSLFVDQFLHLQDGIVLRMN